MNKNVIKSIALMIFLVPSISFAFSIPGVGLGSSGSGNAGPDLNAEQTQLITNYVAANQFVLTANEKMAQALGLSADAAKVKATAAALTSGPSLGNIKKSDTVLSKSIQEVTTNIKNNKAKPLDAASKQLFAAGLVNLAAGVVEYGKLASNIGNVQSSLSSASPMALMNLSPMIYIAKNLPSNAKNLGSTLSEAVTYAKGQDIPVPASATSALGSL